MKKVLFTATVDSHIIHFHLPFLKLFKDNGYEIHVATNGDAEIPYCDVKHKIPFARSPFSIDNLKAIKQLKKIVDEEKFEIIHTHTPMGSVVTRLAAKKARKNGTRVIYTAHGFHFYTGAPLINWMLYYPVEKYLAKYTDTLITINTEDYERAKKKFSKRCKDIQYVPGVGVDPKKFDIKMTKKEKSELRKSLGLKDDDFVLIYVAELNKNKNQSMAIKAMKELVKENSDIKLLLVGKGILEEKYKDMVNNLHLENNVIFTGYRKDVPQLMHISNLAISCSKREGLPVNLIEAQMCSLPIVATNCRGNRDVVAENNNGYMSKINDINNFTEKISLIKKQNVHNKKEPRDYELENIIIEMEKIYRFNMPTRVLQVIRAMNVGGAETLIMNLYRNIDRTQIQFDFLVSRDGIYDDEIKKLGGHIFKIPYLTDKGQLTYEKNIINFLNAHKEYKIIHSHLDQVSGIVMQAAKKANVPIRISHSHSTSNRNKIIAKIYKKFLQKKILKYATNYFACSKESAKWLYKNKSSKAIIINNGIEIDKYIYSNDKRTEIRNEFNIKDEEFVIGHVGAFRTEKNHKFLIEIFNEYLKINTKSKLLLVGDGYLKKDIIEMIKKYKLEKDVILAGVRKDVYKFYSAFDCFIFPSIYEGISLSLIEAQVSGIPIVTSNSIDKLTKINKNFYMLPINDNLKWINKINFLRENVSSKIIDINKFKKYNITLIAKKIETIYKKII